MEDSKRLAAALRRQFEWVNLLLLDKGKSSSTTERRQAMVFCTMHVCFVLMVFAHLVTVIASWALAFVLQTVNMAVAALYLSHLRMYADKRLDAIALERLGNPLLVAQMSVRVFSLFHGLLMRAKTMFLLALLEILYDAYVSRRHSLLVDPTTLWKEVRWRERDSLIRFGYQAFLTAVSVGHFLLSLAFAS